jgi:heptosyltransferase III
MKTPKHILICRTDAIGDVILTLPLVAIIKQHFPNVKISFLGKSYTEPIIKNCPWVDEYVEREVFLEGKWSGIPDTAILVFPEKEVVKACFKYKIPNRIGTAGRWWNWLYCNKRVFFSRKNSPLHESQLNLKLLSVIGINKTYSLEELSKIKLLNKLSSRSENPERRIQIILHPGSRGSARDWSLDKYKELIGILPTKEFRVIISGSKAESISLNDWINSLGDNVENYSGKLNLEDFMRLISESDVLVAASTGPLHIAAALGIRAIGIYPSIRPMHAGRWSPIGLKAISLFIDKDCSDCKKGGTCNCVDSIPVTMVKNNIFEV